MKVRGRVMIIRQSSSRDLPALLEVLREAFGEGEGPVIVELVKNLLDDPTAAPLLSLVSLEGERLTGYLLFTNARIAMHEEVPTSLLAPVAVVPDRQAQGTGSLLIAEGLQLLFKRGIELVFVLGHPEYYPRFDFKPAGVLGFEAPYPIPEEAAQAWMVRELTPGVIGKLRGKILCAESLGRPEYWQE